MAEHVERIGQRIRERRNALRLTQGELARRLPTSVDGSQISRWERGVHEPSAEHKEALAKALQTTVMQFLADGRPAKPTPDPLATDMSGEALDTRLTQIERKLDELLEILRGPEATDLDGDLPDDSRPSPEPPTIEGDPREPPSDEGEQERQAE